MGVAESQENTTYLLLRPVFQKAQEIDEFEYVCALLRVRGVEAPGWDALNESDALADSVLSLIQAPLEGVVKLRLGLLLYMHVTEMSAPYHVIANILRVCTGDRYSLDPFRGTKSPWKKIATIRELAAKAGFTNVGSHFATFFSPQIRNAFAHSDYAIHGDRFNIIEGPGLEIEGVITRSIPIETHLLLRINGGISFLLGFMTLLQDSVRAYQAPKILPARIGAGGEVLDAELIIEPGKGVVGFRSPPDV